MWLRGWDELFEITAAGDLALALLVARVVTDDHDPAVPADDPALVADPLDARLDLHGCALTLVRRDWISPRDPYL